MVSETIESKSYILGIQKTNLIPDIYTIFYNCIDSHVSNTNTTNGRAKWIFPTFPEDLEVNDSNSYPIIVINSPNPEWSKLTQAKKTSNNDINIYVYSTSKKELDRLTQYIINAVEENWRLFRSIKLDHINLGRISEEHVNRGKISVHIKVIPFTCDFSFRRT